MKTVCVSASARRDLDSIWLFVARESQSIETAGKAVDSITACFTLLAQAPELGRQREEYGAGLRSFPAGRYIIYYRRKGSRLQVVRVIHGKRDQTAAYLGRAR